jgi:hypothetical protein
VLESDKPELVSSDRLLQACASHSYVCRDLRDYVCRGDDDDGVHDDHGDRDDASSYLGS